MSFEVLPCILLVGRRIAAGLVSGKHFAFCAMHVCSGSKADMAPVVLNRLPYRIAFAVSTSRALVVAVASTVPSSAVNLPSTKAIVLPSWVTLASPVIGPGLAGL